MSRSVYQVRFAECMNAFPTRSILAVGNGFIRSVYRVRFAECMNAFPTVSFLAFLGFGCGNLK